MKVTQDFILTLQDNTQHFFNKGTLITDQELLDNWYVKLFVEDETPVVEPIVETQPTE